jgi:CrcB protein
MPPILLVALGSAAGGVARWALAGWIDARTGPGFWGTLAVNMLGGLAIGAAAALLGRESLRLLLITGVLGGFTTFSAYSLQTLTLLQGERYGAAAGYAVGSVLACLLACWAGWALARPFSAAGS